MASVNSPIRKFLKPILYKLFGKNLYLHFQVKAKIRDIDLKLVEEDELELLPYFTNKESESVDIGANYAYYTVKLAALSKKIIAFEPIPFTFKVCKKIIQHYKLNNVELHQLGIGEKNEDVVFNVPQLDFGAISAGQAHIDSRNNELKGKEQHYKFNKSEKVNCQIIQLDTFLNKLSNVSFIKMDIEGAEFFALKGMKKIIEQFKPVILLEINPFFLEGFKIKEAELNELIKSFDYETFIYNKAKKRLEAFNSNYYESNYILIHKSNISKYDSLIK